MKRSRYQLKPEADLAKKTIALYKTGLTMREVAEKVGRSRMYVCRVVNQYLPKAFDVTTFDKVNK